MMSTAARELEQLKRFSAGSSSRGFQGRGARVGQRAQAHSFELEGGSQEQDAGFAEITR